MGETWNGYGRSMVGQRHKKALEVSSLPNIHRGFLGFPPANFWCGQRNHSRPHQRANSWNPLHPKRFRKRLNSQGCLKYNPNRLLCQAGGIQLVTNQTDDIAEILISSEAIAAKVQELGRLVTDTYQGNDLLLVSVLKGAVVFLTDLMRAIPLPLAIDFLAISSYGGKGAAG